MKFSLPMLMALSAGGLLLWSGLTDRNPVGVLKAILTGQDVPAKGSGNPKAPTAPVAPTK